MVDVRKRLRIPRNTWTDTAFLSVVLLALNALLSPADIGWQRLPVSPYLLLPMLVGARYGPLPGVVAGAVGAAITRHAFWRQDLPLLDELWLAHGYLLCAFVAVGALCGELYHALHKKTLQLTALNADLEKRLRHLNTDLYLLREAKLELERLLITRDAELSTLDADLRRLFDTEGDDVYRSLLLLLQQQARLADGAVYRLDTAGVFERKAVLGNAERLPERVQPGEIDMLDLVLKRRTAVSVPEFWDRPGDANRDHLLAVPLLDSNDEPLGAVLVSGMPFMALTRKTVRLVALTCRWAARVIELRHEDEALSRSVPGILTQRVYRPESFRRHVDLAHSAFRLHDLPSSLVVFSARANPTGKAEDFDRLVLGQVRNGDFVGELGLPFAHLVVLLPLTGERGAHIFIDRLREVFRKDPKMNGAVGDTLITFSPQQSIDQLWSDLTKHAQACAGSA